MVVVEDIQQRLPSLSGPVVGHQFIHIQGKDHDVAGPHGDLQLQHLLIHPLVGCGHAYGCNFRAADRTIAVAFSQFHVAPKVVQVHIGQRHLSGIVSLLIVLVLNGIPVLVIANHRIGTADQHAQQHEPKQKSELQFGQFPFHVKAFHTFSLSASQPPISSAVWIWLRNKCGLVWAVPRSSLVRKRPIHPFFTRKTRGGFSSPNRRTSS